MPKINDLFVCVTKDPDGDEGILTMPSEIGGCPLLTGNPDRVARVREMAEKISRDTGLPFRFLRYALQGDATAEDVRRAGAEKDPPRPYRIERLWAFIAAEGPGPEDEGIMASNMGGGPVIVPLVGADPHRAACYLEEAELVSKVHGKAYRIARFELAGETTRRF